MQCPHASKTLHGALSSSKRLMRILRAILANLLVVAHLARLTMIMGAPATKELIFSARLLSAEELKATGALREIVRDPSALLTRAQEIGEKFVQLAPLTLWGTKEGMRRLRDAMLPSISDVDIVKACYRSQD